jgi:glutathione S-transferase
MANKLYVVPGSHPSACAAAALDLKGIEYQRVDLLPMVHKPIVKVIAGATTVPVLKLDGEKIVGSRSILRRLDDVVAEPRLYPADADERAAVERAEEWGDEVLQSVARRISWASIKRNPKAAKSFTADSKMPLPDFMVDPVTPLVARLEVRVQKATDANVQADLRSLPGHLDRVDRWIVEGVLGGETPNAADLQIAASLRLMERFGDIRPLLEGRPCAQLAAKYFPPAVGDMPAGTLPAEWMAAAAAP